MKGIVLQTVINNFNLLTFIFLPPPLCLGLQVKWVMKDGLNDFRGRIWRKEDWTLLILCFEREVEWGVVKFLMEKQRLDIGIGIGYCGLMQRRIFTKADQVVMNETWHLIFSMFFNVLFILFFQLCFYYFIIVIINIEDVVHDQYFLFCNILFSFLLIYIS